MPRLGVDLGGTKIEAVVLRADGDVVARERRATPRHGYDATVDAVASLVRDLETAVGARCTVGVGIPGTVSHQTGLVKNANSTWLIGRPLQQDLEAALGRAVRLANDANCFALSEARDGAAEGADVVFGVILGTGTGGGLVVRGEVWDGVNGIAGEWGHNPIPWPEPDEWPGATCYCGRSGCLETGLSGPGLARDHFERSGERLAPEQIVARASAGQEAANATLERYVRRLARGLASVINVLDPDVVVLGGGLSNIGRLYAEVPAAWQRFVFSDRVETRLVPARYGDASGVRGAAWLWNRA